MHNLTPSTLAALPHATHRLADLEAAFNTRRRATQRHALLLAQPTMSWVDGVREQPRDGRGRFLPRTWLADAELFLPSDRAFFRRPLTASVEL